MKSLPVILVFAVLIVVAIILGGLFLLNQSSEPQPTPSPTPSPTPTPQPVGEIRDEETVTKLIETLPDIELLRGLSLQKGTEGITTRVVERPESNSTYFVVEIWEDLSGEPKLFQRYRYNALIDELTVDLPLNPSGFDIFTRSVLDVKTGEMVAVIDLGRSDLGEEGRGRQECATGSQMVLNFCAGRAADLADSMLNVIYQRILADSTISEETKSTLIESQGQWVQQKEKECAPKFNDSGQYDGSIQPLLAASCRESMTRERIDILLNTYLK